MNNKNEIPVNISAPNLINICVDGMKHEEIQGRIYHYYSEEPIMFFSIMELIREMENLFNDLVFPQAATRSRSFFEKGPEPRISFIRPQKYVSAGNLMGNNGRFGTFVTCVKYRQGSTWQGEVFWKEQDKKFYFSNALEFMREISEALGKREKRGE